MNALQLLTRFGLTKQPAGGGGGSIQIDATATGGTASAATSHSVPMPSGSGGLLVMLFRATRGTGNAGVTAPTGWTKASSGATSWGELAVLYRVADGSEGANVTVATDSVAYAAFITHRISGSETSGTYLEATVSAMNASDPPSLTPSWGAAENLWLAVDSTRDPFAASFTGDVPTDYSGFVEAASVEPPSNNQQTRIASAHRVVNAASQDPNAYGRSGTFEVPYTATVAVRPA